jgi:hypothetical protein
MRNSIFMEYPIMLKKYVFSVLALLMVFSNLLLAHSTALAYTPTANGCGPENGPKVPNYFSFWNPFGRTDRYPFVNACNRHDICYGTLGSNRAACDQQFLSDLLAICAANGSTAVSRTYCRGLAYTYYGAVAAFGGWAFDAAQAKARAG